ncbi:MAG: hypothetical protein R3224_10965, partial [Balneolaceae bacterium]|nr:hypothetical protein [Balneolaceae bacterium]
MTTAAAWELQAQQVQSDYEIQQNFSKQVGIIQSVLDTVESVAATEGVIRDIKTLEEEYADHQQLLNQALYPETFEQRIEELKKRTVVVRQRLATIEKQNDKLTTLNTELADYTNRLERLNARTDSLRSAIAKSTRNEKNLSGRLREYRESLERRDRLVLSIIDSMMVAYQNLNIQSAEELADAREQSRIDAGGSPLKMVRSIAAENVQFLNSSPKLAAGDYLRMNAVRHKFSALWSRMADRLITVYGDDGEEQIRGTI